MIKIHTIGVYNSTENSFFDKLKNNDIDLFCDIRQRRGVRGSQYKFVNSNYLQSKLSDMGIKYLYIKELAPTKEIRQKQKDADKLNGETKKQRTTLGEIFASEYRNQILDKFDLNNLIGQIKATGTKNVVFFCVEEQAEACHRSLVANKIGKLLGSEIKNL